MKKWPKGVVFWTTKGVGKSSDKKSVSVSVSESDFGKGEEKKRAKKHRQRFVYAEPKAMSSNVETFETVGKRRAFPARPVNKNAGRPNCLDEEKLTQLFDAYYSRPYSLRELADMFGVSRMTVWRAVQDAPVFPR